MLRVCTEDDASERILADAEQATGRRPSGCPWRAYEDPFVGHVLSAYRWFKAGALETRIPDPPEALLRGLEVYDAALNAVQGHDLREERKRREKERRERELKSAAARGRR